MAITVTPRYNANTRVPAPAGDLATAIYDVAVAAGPNAYPLGGEPISFLADFHEVHAVIVDGIAIVQPAGPGAASGGGVGVAWERDTANTGRLRFYTTGAINTFFMDAPAGAYPAAFLFTLTVLGRPATDAS